MLRSCIGLRESGKTTLALFLSRRSNVDIVFDPRGMVPRRGIVREQVDCRDQDAIAAVFTRLEHTTIDDRSAGLEIVVTPDNDCVEDFDFLCREIKAWVRREDPAFALLVDEPSFVELKKGDAFSWLARCTGRDRVQLTLTGHRPIDVPTHLRAVVDYWCMFRMAMPDDLVTVSKTCNEPELSELLPRLNDREFIRYDVTYNGPDRRQAMRLFNKPDKWFVPLSRTLVQQNAIELEGEPVTAPPKPDRPLPLLDTDDFQT